MESQVIKFRPRLIVQRLKDAGFQSGLHGDFQSLKNDRALRAGSCFVMAAEDDATGIPDSKAIEYDVLATFGVVLVARSYRIDLANSIDDLEAMRDRAIAALSGFRYQGIGSIFWTGGELLDGAGTETILWLDRFVTSYNSTTEY